MGRRGTQGPVPILEIAEARKLPLHVLEQLFASLRRTGILRSQRGVRGGYSFARSADEVTLLEVVECVDGAIGIATDPTPRPVDAVWQEICQAISRRLGGITIADIVEREIHASGTMMFHI